jgi:hypothetical protein
MYYHTLEHKYYATYSQGFHFKKFTNEVCRPRAYKAATYRKDNPKWKLTDEVEADNGTPPESWGKRISGVVGNSHVPANITDKKTADAICAYLNANPELKPPFLTPEILGRALTALGYGTLEEYLAPKIVAATVSTPANQLAAYNPLKPSGGTFNLNTYIRATDKGTFSIAYRGYSISKMPTYAHAVEALLHLRARIPVSLGNAKAETIEHMATWQPLEDLA